MGPTGARCEVRPGLWIPEKSPPPRGVTESPCDLGPLGWVRALAQSWASGGPRRSSLASEGGHGAACSRALAQTPFQGGGEMGSGRPRAPSPVCHNKS